MTSMLTAGEKEALRKEIHIKGLFLSKNAKDCGDLTVVPLGYVSQIAMEFIEKQLEGKVMAIREEIDSLKMETIKEDSMDKPFNAFDFMPIHVDVFNEAVEEALSLPSLQISQK